MQSRGLLLAVLFSVIIFSISGLLPSASAAQIQLTETSCENGVDATGQIPIDDNDVILDLQGTWNTDTCTLPSDVDVPPEIEIGYELDEETPVILIISGPVTLNIPADSILTIFGGIESQGTIEISGDVATEDEGSILNLNSFTINSGGSFTNLFDFLGSGSVTNFGDIFVEDGDFNPDGLVTNSGTVTLNDGSLNPSNGFTNTEDGIVEINANFITTSFDNFGEFTINEDGILDIAGSDVETGVFTNHPDSTLESSGTIDLDPTGQLVNLEGFSTTGTSVIELGGTVTNHDTFTNNGLYNIAPTGKIENFGTFFNDGMLTLTSNGADIATFDGSGGNGLTNNNTIKNTCGLILGAFSGTDPLDLCEFELTILTPSLGQTVSDAFPTTFSGIGQDRDAFGIPIDSSENIDWISTKDGFMGTGSSIDFQLISLGNHDITASVLDPDNNLVESTISILVSQVDKDNDGVPVQDDCDDNDPLNYPGNMEVFDGQDNDCDGQVDEGFSDDDMDGFDSSEDCNDADATVYPGATEVVDGQDNNCDTILLEDEIDNDGDLHIPGIFDSNIWVGDESVIGGLDCDDSEPARYLGNTEIVDGIDNNCVDGIPDNETDDDNDGHIEAEFDSNIWVGDESVIGGLDCDDSEPLSNPSLTEIDGDGIDNDCDGMVDSSGDFDEDGFLGGVDDCNDADATVYPGATEVVDGQDNNCDTILLEDEIDNDGDGYIPGEFDPIGGWDGTLQVLGDNDCNDITVIGVTIYPGAPELDDGVDNDCDGVVPPNEIDEDNDGSTADLDCDDNDPARSPEFEEIVDGIDNNCDDVLPDNEIDDDTDMYIDGIFDVNGWFGTPDVTGDNDCDDANEAINPGATEILDGFDNNCDTVLLDDEIDDDGDGQAEFQGDCDDDDKFNFLGNDERDDGKDNNCDGIIDEGFDLDGDGTTPIGGGDCDDSNPFTYQGALEIPDGEDNDCNGFIDDLQDKFTTPELQENLDDKTIKDYEKQVEDLEDEIEDLEYENRKLDKYADKYEDKAEDALEGDTRKVAYYQAKSDRYEDKANEALEDGKERKAAKYQKTSDYFQAKADRALEGDPEKAAKYQAKADELRAEIASNESLIEMYGKEILVINMSIGEIPVDWSQTIVVTYDNLTDEAFDDILDDIKDNLEEIEKLEEKAVNYDEKADKEEAKGNQEKADKYRLKAIQAREEIEIIEDLNTVLKCAIDFTDEMLLEEVELSIKIDRNSDDAEEGNDSDNLLDMKLKSSDLDLVEESEYVGLRFNDIPLEQGQIIKSAYIQFTSEDKDNGNAVVTIYGQDIDDAPTFTNTDGDISSRTLTSASVTWDIPDWDDNKSKSDQRTSDITSILEEIVNRPNWSEDNSMVFIITDGQGSDRDAYTYDEKSSKAAVLHITTLTDDHKPHHGHDHDDDDDRNGKGHDKHNDKYHDDD